MWSRRRGGERSGAFFLDLDQDNAKHTATNDMPFEAELALVSGSNGTFVYLDSDNDGHFDILMVDHASDNEVDAGFRFNKAGLWIEDPTLAKKRLVDLSLFDRSRIAIASGRSMEASTGIFLRMLGREKASEPELIAAARGLGVPDYLTGAGFEGQAIDLDDDGKPDGISLQGDNAEGFLLTPHNPILQSKDEYSTVKALLQERKLHPVLSVIYRGGTTWVQYDINGDQKIDYVLSAPGGSRYGFDRNSVQIDFAFDAIKIDGAGNRTVATELLGRSLIQPNLFSDKSIAKYLRQLPMLMQYNANNGDERDTLPEHNYGMVSRGEPAIFDVGALKKIGLVRGGTSSRIYRLDLDGDTQRGIDQQAAARKQEIAEWSKRNKGKRPDWLREDSESEQDLIAGFVGSLNDEVACLIQGSGRWCFYDEDNDDAADLVLFSSHGVDNDGVVDSAYRIDNDTRKVTFARDEIHGNVLRLDVFKSPSLSATWQKIVATGLPLPVDAAAGDDKPGLSPP
jgi:hypothetical protein